MKQKEIWWDKKKIAQNLRKQYFFKIDHYFLMNYMYFKSIRQFYDFKNFYNFYPFFYKITEFFDHINKLYFYKKYYYKQDRYKFFEEDNKWKTENFFPSPLKKRKTKDNILKNHVQLLKGYKIEFRGRFTRKQKAAHLWHVRGGKPLSAMDQNVEIGLQTINMKYGKCSVKVWLYKANSYPTFYVRF